MPSIQEKEDLILQDTTLCFKPYYNWNAFNTNIYEYGMHVIGF